MKLEIYRAFFVAFGFMELFTNLRYLLIKDGLKYAKKQHQEIPQTATDSQLKRKVLLMLVSGSIFLISGIYSYLTHEIPNTLFMIVLLLFAIYALVEAIYYRYRNTLGFALISIAAFVIYL